MIRAPLVIIAVVWSLYAYGQGAAAADFAVLMEGCAAIPDQARRASCFETLSRLTSRLAGDGSSQKKTADQLKQERRAALKEKWVSVNRAATVLQSAIDVGVSRNQYSPYVQQFAAELALMRQKPREKSEDQAIAYFEKAIDAYRDAGTFWDACIAFFSRSNNRLAYAGGLPLRMNNMEWIVSKWGIPTQNADIFGLHRGIPQSTGLSMIWHLAKQAVEWANIDLIREPEPGPAIDPGSPN